MPLSGNSVQVVFIFINFNLLTHYYKMFYIVFVRLSIRSPLTKRRDRGPLINDYRIARAAAGPLSPVEPRRKSMRRPSAGAPVRAARRGGERKPPSCARAVRGGDATIVRLLSRVRARFPFPAVSWTAHLLCVHTQCRRPPPHRSSGINRDSNNVPSPPPSPGRPRPSSTIAPLVFRPPTLLPPHPRASFTDPAAVSARHRKNHVVT